MTTSMQAAVITSPRVCEVRLVPIPVPAAGEVVVKLQGCGVCASNVPPWEGREWFSYPLEAGQLGHEGWGTVHQVGSNVAGFSIGQRVAMLSNHSYAQYDKAPATALVPLPPDLAEDFPGEPLGCAVNIFARSGIKAGDTIAIVGIGFLGALLTRLAKNAGARVIAVSRRLYSLEFAKDHGADELVVMDDHWAVVEAVKRLTDQRLCDVVIEAVGKQWPLDLAADLCREMGRLVIAGYHQDGLRQVNMQLWNWRGLDVINAHEREESKYTDGIATAARHVASGQLQPERLYSHCLELADLALALELARTRPEGFMKALIRLG